MAFADDDSKKDDERNLDQEASPEVVPALAKLQATATSAQNQNEEKVEEAKQDSITHEIKLNDEPKQEGTEEDTETKEPKDASNEMDSNQQGQEDDTIADQSEPHDSNQSNNETTKNKATSEPPNASSTSLPARPLKRARTAYFIFTDEKRSEIQAQVSNVPVLF